MAQAQNSFSCAVLFLSRFAISFSAPCRKLTSLFTTNQYGEFGVDSRILLIPALRLDGRSDINTIDSTLLLVIQVRDRVLLGKRARTLPLKRSTWQCTFTWLQMSWRDDFQTMFYSVRERRFCLLTDMKRQMRLARPGSTTL